MNKINKHVELSYKHKFISRLLLPKWVSECLYFLQNAEPNPPLCHILPAVWRVWGP